MTAVRLAGDGPAAEAVAAALADTDATVTRTDGSELGAALAGADLGILVAPVGADAFDAATGAARETGTPWLSVELGGIGGHELGTVDAAVSGLGTGTACFDCLRTRVAAGMAGRDGTAGDATGETDAATARFAGALAGRAAADLVAGRETATLGRVVEVPHAERRLLPVPGCACERDAPGPDLDRSVVERSLDESVDRLERAVDPRVGPIRELSEAESFPAPYYLADLAATPFSDGSTGGLAAGVAADWNAAFGKALGEGLERYAAAVYREAEFERAPASAVEGAVPPARFVRPAADGAGDWHAPDPEERLPWVAGEALGTGERAWLPAEFAVFPPPDGARHRPAITTGLGFGSGVDALLSGLYEVVERDAAMLAWYSTYEPLGLAVSDDALDRAGENDPLATYDTLRRRARSEGLATTALLLTQDVDVPVVACAVHREDGWPRFAAGMAADLDASAAARDALAEALQNWMELRGMGRQGATEQEPTVARAADLPRGVRAFCDPETTVPLGSVGGDDPPEPSAEFDTLLGRVTGAGLDAYAARLTTRDVAALGFEAVRVLVPSAQPLFTGEPYFGDRAREVPAMFGCEPRLDRAAHPFP